LIDPKARFWNADWKIKAMSYSMSLMVIYFGFKKDDQPLDLQHHNIILGKRYEGLLKDIFERKVLSADYSQYLHIPTLTDPSMAPDGYHTAYTLIPVPNKRGNDIDWKTEGPKLSAKVLQELEQNGFIPNLASRLKYIHFITPDYFESELNAFAGNAFGVQPIFRQTAFFRPHNRSEDIANLYLVGASTMPGAGVPSVMMSAKITTKLIADDFKI
jgi:phytoene desaturase